MTRSRITAIAAGLALLGLIVAAVLNGWRPPFVNRPVSGALDSPNAWQGLTPFTDWTASFLLVGLVLAVFVIAVWLVAERTVGRSLAKLQADIARMQMGHPHIRESTRGSRTLEELVEDLVRINRLQHDDLMRRIIRLEQRLGEAEPVTHPVQAPPSATEIAEDMWSEEPERIARAPETVRPTFQPKLRTVADTLDATRHSRLAQIEEEYRQLLLDPGPTAFRAFLSRHRVVGLAASGASLVETGGQNALLLGVPLEGGATALLPGQDLISDFGTVYYAQRSMPDEVRLAFEFEVDGSRSLKLLRAGLAQSNGAAYGVTRIGAIGGLEA